MSDMDSLINIGIFAAVFYAGWACRSEVARWRVERALDRAEKRLAARGIFPPDEHGRKP